MTTAARPPVPPVPSPGAYTPGPSPRRFLSQAVWRWDETRQALDAAERRVGVSADLVARLTAEYRVRLVTIAAAVEHEMAALDARPNDAHHEDTRHE